MVDARHADQDDVRLRQTRGGLAVVVGQDVVHRIDPAEIVGIQRILPPRPGGGLFSDQFLQEVHHRVEHVDDRDVQPQAGGFQFAAQGAIDQGGQHRSRLMLDAFQHPVKLEAGANRAPPVMDDVRMLELDRRCPGYGVQRLAGRVGDQVKIDPLVIHRG